MKEEKGKVHSGDILLFFFLFFFLHSFPGADSMGSTARHASHDSSPISEIAYAFSYTTSDVE